MKHDDLYCFGQSVACRIRKMKSQKKAMKLRAQIDSLINDAVIDEMSD
jgi:hypothetical protein